jgi:hypothetical protein
MNPKELMQAIDAVEVLLETIPEQRRREQCRALLLQLRRELFTVWG